MPKLNALVAGSTGYIGVQLIKLLIKHKYINIKYLCGSTSVGKKIDSFEQELKKYKLPKISKFKKKEKPLPYPSGNLSDHFPMKHAGEKVI